MLCPRGSDHGECYSIGQRVDKLVLQPLGVLAGYIPTSNTHTYTYMYVNVSGYVHGYILCIYVYVCINIHMSPLWKVGFFCTHANLAVKDWEVDPVEGWPDHFSHLTRYLDSGSIFKTIASIPNIRALYYTPYVLILWVPDLNLPMFSAAVPSCPDQAL